MFKAYSNAYFGAETQTEAVGEYDGVLPKALSVYHTTNYRDVWITDDESGKVLWHNGREVAPKKLSNRELYKELSDAIANERRKADLAGYFGGSSGTKGEYEQAQARTNSLINQLLTN